VLTSAVSGMSKRHLDPNSHLIEQAPSVFSVVPETLRTNLISRTRSGNSLVPHISSAKLSLGM
jgi:hypothetical protein